MVTDNSRFELGKKYKYQDSCLYKIIWVDDKGALFESKDETRFYEKHTSIKLYSKTEEIITVTGWINIRPDNFNKYAKRRTGNIHILKEDALAQADSTVLDTIAITWKEKV